MRLLAPALALAFFDIYVFLVVPPTPPEKINLWPCFIYIFVSGRINYIKSNKVFPGKPLDVGSGNLRNFSPEIKSKTSRIALPKFRLIENQRGFYDF